MSYRFLPPIQDPALRQAVHTDPVPSNEYTGSQPTHTRQLHILLHQKAQHAQYMTAPEVSVAVIVSKTQGCILSFGSG